MTRELFAVFTVGPDPSDAAVREVQKACEAQSWVFVGPRGGRYVGTGPVKWAVHPSERTGWGFMDPPGTRYLVGKRPARRVRRKDP